MHLLNWLAENVSFSMLKRWVLVGLSLVLMGFSRNPMICIPCSSAGPPPGLGSQRIFTTISVT
jgi:hypothetical protein